MSSQHTNLFEHPIVPNRLVTSLADRVIGLLIHKPKTESFTIAEKGAKNGAVANLGGLVGPNGEDATERRYVCFGNKQGSIVTKVCWVRPLVTGRTYGTSYL